MADHFLPARIRCAAPSRPRGPSPPSCTPLGRGSALPRSTEAALTRPYECHPRTRSMVGEIQSRDLCGPRAPDEHYGTSIWTRRTYTGAARCSRSRAWRSFGDGSPAGGLCSLGALTNASLSRSAAPSASAGSPAFASFAGRLLRGRADDRGAGPPTTAPTFIERTNSWLSNFGRLRRNTDRRVPHRLAQLALAVALLLTAKLIDWRDRWSPA